MQKTSKSTGKKKEPKESSPQEVTQRILDDKKETPKKSSLQNDEFISKYESRPKTYKKERFVKNQYKNRTSLLDDNSEDSYLNNSAFIGFVNLGKLIAFTLIITIPIVFNYLRSFFYFY